MHLRLMMPSHDRWPQFVLATGALEKTDHLVRGDFCDSVVSDWNALKVVRSWCETKTAVSRVKGTISKQAFVDYMAYVGRDSHGGYYQWSTLPAEEAYPHAVAYYTLKRARDMKKRNLMLIQPLWSIPAPEPDNTVERCFVLMPFSAELSEFYRSIIKPAVTEAGVVCERADDIFGPGHIMTDIWSKINKASFVIADLTGKNPNVFYELGIAHSIGKKAILLAQSIEDVPFDVRDRRVLLYSTRFDGIQPLREALLNAITEIRSEMHSEAGVEHFPDEIQEGTEIA
jgi:hypothetical protein